MAGRPSLWSKAQWDWAIDKVCNHYYNMYDMVEFLGTSYNTLHARIRRYGLSIKRYYHPNDLKEHKAEFLVLEGEKTRGLWNEVQWDWAIDLVCNRHYHIEDVAEFIGISRVTLLHRIQRSGLAITRWYHPNDLEKFREEFLALGKEDTKCTIKSQKKKSRGSRSSKRTVK